MAVRQIDIDWDIHKLIEAERQGFDEPPYIALRRLLHLPAITAESGTSSDEKAYWSEDGVTVPNGSLARMSYQRGEQLYEGKFSNGKLIVGNQSFTSLSAAANALATTRKGARTSLNGWNYWEVKFPGSTDWKLMASLRQQ